MNKNRSVLFVFLASVCFSTGGLFIKLVPWNALAINGARNLIGAAVIGTFLLAARRRIVFSRRVLVGALSMIGVTTLFALANKLTTAANTIVLQFTAPVFVILFMAVFYRQEPGRVDLAVCFLVLLGVVLFFVDGIRAGNLLGNVLAVLSGICYAGVFMMNTGENADAISSCFLGQLAAGLAMAPLCLREMDFSAPVMASVIALGVVQVGGAYILFSIGIRDTPAVTASLITGMEPILNPLLVAAFYGERITTLSVIGCVIVVCSILAYNVWLAKKKRNLPEEQAGTGEAGNRQGENTDGLIQL
ncbi:MAG: DMT family transporter [Clostridia bacterium]|nr:DMT family transporter [Clostridia bacterium]